MGWGTFARPEYAIGPKGIPPLESAYPRGKGLQSAGKRIAPEEEGR